MLVSGGVDSGVVAAAACRASAPCEFIFFDTPFTSQADRDSAGGLAFHLGISLTIHYPDEHYWNTLAANPEDRCYQCKSLLFGAIGSQKRSIADGTNAEDVVSQDRPGLKANQEYNIISPLANLGLNKSAVREVAYLWGLPVQDRPSQSCLATRFPHGRLFDLSELRLIEAIESLLLSHCSDCRARFDGELLRLEIRDIDPSNVLGSREDIEKQVRDLGFSGPIEFCHEASCLNNNEKRLSINE